MTRRGQAVLATLGVLLGAVMAGCGVSGSTEGTASSGGRAVATDEIAVSVPDGWDGRVLFLDPGGEKQLVQVANFPLPDQERFDAPEELPPGEEDL